MSSFIAVSAIVPSLLLIWYFHSHDLNPEPTRMIWATFVLGLLTPIPVLIVDQPIMHALATQTDPFVRGFGEAFFVAGFPEEGFKFLVLLLFCLPNKEFDEPMDGIVYGAIASLGFATFENILYVSHGGIQLAIFRAVTAVPGHAFMGAIMGYYVGQAKFQPARRTALLARGYFTAVLLHGLYDAGILTLQTIKREYTEVPKEFVPAAAGLMIMTLAVLVFEWRWAVRLVGRLRTEQYAIAAAHHAQVVAAQAQAQGVAYAPPQYAQPMPQSEWPATRPAMPVWNPGAVPVASRWAPAWAPPSHAALAPVPPKRSAGAMVAMAIGGLLATGGGLMCLGVTVDLIFGNGRDTAEAGPLIVGTVIIGVLPLALGIALFARGLKRLHPAAATMAAA